MSKELKSDRKLPMNALRFLDACARHLSFTTAAEELRVTQAAVSHQIKLLERYLGSRLFLRLGRGVRLTHEGTHYLAAVRASLTHLDHAAAKLRAGRGDSSVTCSIATTIATRWLMPKLRSFSLQFPDIVIRLDLTERFVNFSTEQVDLAIRYGRGEWPGLLSELLFAEVLVPVCSRELLQGRRGLLQIRDLKKHTLLHSSASMNDWEHWLDAHGATNVGSKKGLIFEQPHLALQAAAEGLGVAMADRALAQRDIDAGRLVIPFPGGLARSEGYYVVGKPETRNDLHCGRFWRWLVAQVNETLPETAANHVRAASAPAPAH